MRRKRFSSGLFEKLSRLLLSSSEDKNMKGSTRGNAQEVEMREEVQEQEEEIQWGRSSIPRSQAYRNKGLINGSAKKVNKLLSGIRRREDQDDERTDAGAEYLRTLPRFHCLQLPSPRFPPRSAQTAWAINSCRRAQNPFRKMLPAKQNTAGFTDFFNRTWRIKRISMMSSDVLV